MANTYQQIGRKTLSLVVENFYNKMLSDSRVNHLFDEVDLTTQKLSTIVFLSLLMGGKSSYKSGFSGRCLQSKDLTDEQLCVFEENWYCVLLDMDLPNLVPIISKGMNISRCVKNLRDQ